MAFSASNICRAHIAEGCSPCLALPFLARPELSSMLQVRAQPRARVLSVCTGISMYLCICACCNIENIHERLVNFMHPHSHTEEGEDGRSEGVWRIGDFAAGHADRAYYSLRACFSMFSKFTSRKNSFCSHNIFKISW